MPLVLWPRNHCQLWCLGNFPLCVLVRTLQLWVLHLSFCPLWVTFVYCAITAQLLSLTCGCPVFCLFKDCRSHSASQRFDHDVRVSFPCLSPISRVPVSMCVWPAHHHFDCRNLAISVRIRRCSSSECHSLVHRCDRTLVHSVHGRKDVFRSMTSEALSPLRKEGITVARALQQTCSRKSVRTGARLYDFTTVSPHMYCLCTTWAQRPWRQGGVGILGTRVTDDCGCWELNLVLCKSSKAPGPQ